MKPFSLDCNVYRLCGSGRIYGYVFSTEYTNDYPIAVKFEDGSVRAYKTDGRPGNDSTQPYLFHAEPEHATEYQAPKLPKLTLDMAIADFLKLGYRAEIHPCTIGGMFIALKEGDPVVLSVGMPDLSNTNELQLLLEHVRSARKSSV